MGAALAAVVLLACGCGTTYDVERRETPVHVWLTAPDLAAGGGQLDALIYVGPYKVVQGPVHFPRGGPTVNLPALFIRTGQRVVSVVIDRGRLSTTQTVEIQQESWIQIVVRGGGIAIRVHEQQPDPWGG